MIKLYYKKSSEPGSSKNGFTLIEVLLVILIICIVTAVCMPGYVHFVQKTRLAKTLLPALRVIEQNVAVYYVSKAVMPGPNQYSVVAGDAVDENLRISLDGGEISITIDAPGLLDKIHIFDGQEIRATPEVSEGRLVNFKLSGELAAVLGFNSNSLPF